MKRIIRRLVYTNKTRLFIYLFMIVLFFIADITFTISLIHLVGIETLLRILILTFINLYGVFLVYKGYKYIINKKKIRFILLMFISFIISILMVTCSYFIETIYGEIGNMQEKDKTIYTGYLISLTDTNNIKNVGLINNENDIEGYTIAKEIIKDNKLKYSTKNYNSYEEMIVDLYNGTIEGAFVQSNYVTYFKEEERYQNIDTETKIIYKKSKTVKTEKIESSDKLLTEPFTILLLGVDSTLNSIETTSAFNGDTLMLITFNPKTLNATIFSIPRDLYVPITCRGNNKAKINSSSVGGVACVIDTIKELTDIDIDYYAKINFKGVVDLVEALKGIDVEVTYSFCEQDSNRDFSNQICLEKGFRHLNGEEALAYARHRHSLPTGDLQRIQNQQLIVEAMSKKLLSLNTITDFKDILSSISNNITTNLSRNQMLSAYSILKDMVSNILTSKEALVVKKAYLEVYDMRVYNENYNTYSAALGYYEASLNDIVKAMKENLEIEKSTQITDFSFDANTPYEQKVAGKGLKTGSQNMGSVPNFMGKTVTEAEIWGRQNNINILKEYVNETSDKYNSDYGVGIIANQSVKEGTSIVNLKSITLYINTVS